MDELISTAKLFLFILLSPGRGRGWVRGDVRRFPLT